jgi:hypothetical protein
LWPLPPRTTPRKAQKTARETILKTTSPGWRLLSSTRAVVCLLPCIFSSDGEPTDADALIIASTIFGAGVRGAAVQHLHESIEKLCGGVFQFQSSGLRALAHQNLTQDEHAGKTTQHKLGSISSELIFTTDL